MTVEELIFELQSLCIEDIENATKKVKGRICGMETGEDYEYFISEIESENDFMFIW